RIVVVGRLADGTAHTSVDAEGLILSPGFIDIHTHYDAQLLWDPFASPSMLHGVTTVVGGNCGFTIAPVASSDRQYPSGMFSAVEGIPRDVLDRSLDWDWGSFGEWLAKLRGQLAVNAAFFVGHSTIRRAVVGVDAT